MDKQKDRQLENGQEVGQAVQVIGKQPKVKSNRTNREWNQFRNDTDTCWSET